MPTFEIQPDRIDVEFDVYCDRCGTGLCNLSTTKEKRGRLSVHVDPCPICLKEAEDNAKEE